MQLVILVFIGALSVLAMLYGGVIFLGAFIVDDQTVANQIAAPGLLFLGLGLVGLAAVIVFPIWKRRRSRR